MLISTRQRWRHINNDMTLSVEETSIEQVPATPYLGVTLDQHLTFTEHIDSIISKTSRALGALKRAARYIPQDTRITLYNTLVLPHLDYCATVWGTTTLTNLRRLQKIQNRGMRLVLQCHPRTHIRDMLTELGWLSVTQRISLLICIQVFKTRNNLTPAYMSPLFSTQTHGYGTRSATSGGLFVDRTHPRSLAGTGTRLWNSLPVTIRGLSNQSAFRRACANHLATNHEPL